MDLVSEGCTGKLAYRLILVLGIQYIPNGPYVILKESAVYLIETEMERACDQKKAVEQRG